MAEGCSYTLWVRKSLNHRIPYEESAAVFADTLAGCTKQNLPGAVGKFSFIIASQVANHTRRA